MTDLSPAVRAARLDALEASGLLDAPPSRAFDRVTALVRRLLDVPVSLVSLVDRDRQVFLSQDGLPAEVAEARETPLSHSICQYVVAAGRPVRVEDAPNDPVFCDHGAVRDLDVVGYLGVPVRAPGGEVLGSLCAITTEPRAWSAADLETLAELAAVVEGEVALQDALRAAATRAADRQAATDELQVALDAAHMGRWAIDLRSGAVTQDRRARSVHGLPPGDGPLHVRRVEATVHPEDRSSTVAACLDAIAAGEGARFEHEYRVVGANGDARWIRAAGEVRAAEARVVGVTWDVTDAHEAEAAIRRSEAHLRAVLDGLSAFVAVLSPEGALLGVNRPVTKVSGVRTADVAGVPFWEGPWWAHQPEARDRIRAACHRAAGGEPSRFDTAAEGSTGEPLPIDLAIRPLVDADGRVTHLVASAVDISEREATTAALRESEARYRMLFESIDVGFCLLDVEYDADGTPTDYRFVETNPAFVAQTGLEGADGRRAYELVPDLEPHWLATYAAVAETGEAVRFTDRSDALSRTFDVYAARVGDHTSRRVALLFTDITEREAAAEALRQSRQRLQIALETARLGTFEHDLVAEVTTGDARTREIFGLAPEVPFEAFMDRVYPDDRADIEAQVDRLRADPAMGPLRFRYRTLVDGAQGHVAASIRGEAGPDGRLARVIGALQDVTDWVEAEAAVRESQARFEMALEAARLGTWDLDVPSGRLAVDERWASMLGYAADALDPHVSMWERLAHPDDRSVAEAAIQAHVEGGAAQYEAEYRMRAADGSWRWILSRGQVVARDPAGAPLRAVGFHLDITERVAVTDELERRVAERTAELERSNAELDQFAYVASHDLKAPLRAIDSLASWIEEDAGDRLPAPSARHLGLLRSRAARMEGLLDSLLTYSRVGRQEAAPEPVDLRALVEDAVAMVAPPEGFDVRVEGAFPRIVTARAPLELVVRNLVGNAIKHHDRADGRVTVSAAAADDWATITVTDDGPGIAPAYQDRVFGLFQTLRPRDEVEGSGMGLSIVRKAVEARGGWVVLASDGRGSTFRFTWPLRPDVASASPSP